MTHLPSNAAKLVATQYRTTGNLQARSRLHQRFATNPYDWMAWVFDQWPALPPNARVLEAGCGTGRLWEVNAGRVPAGWSLTLTDQSSAMVEQADATLAASKLAAQARVLIAPADQLPAEPGSIDLIVANHMLYHVPDLPATLREFRRVLKPGGWLCAATNGDAHMGELNTLYHDFAGEAGRMSMALSFTLENGADLLRPVFPEIALIRRPNQLRVDDAEALADYIESMVPGQTRREPLLAYVREAMRKAGGVIVITTDSGLFLARG